MILSLELILFYEAAKFIIKSNKAYMKIVIHRSVLLNRRVQYEWIIMKVFIKDHDLTSNTSLSAFPNTLNAYTKSIIAKPGIIARKGRLVSRKL